MTVGITELPPEGMQLGGVALAGDEDRGTRTTEGLSLLFTTAGITVQGPQPQIERLLVWSGLDSAVCHEKIDLPDGRNAVVLELRSGGQSIRFLLPMDAVTPGQAAYLDQALPAWLARYKGSRGPSEPMAPAPPPPTAPADEAAAAAAAAAAAGAAVASTGNRAGLEASKPGSTAESSATSTSGPASQPPPPLSFRFPTPSRAASGEGAAPPLRNPPLTNQRIRPCSVPSGQPCPPPNRRRPGREPAPTDRTGWPASQRRTDPPRANASNPAGVEARQKVRPSRQRPPQVRWPEERSSEKGLGAPRPPSRPSQVPDHRRRPPRSARPRWRQTPRTLRSRPRTRSRRTTGRCWRCSW